jgi:hypothetical protein
MKNKRLEFKEKMTRASSETCYHAMIATAASLQYDSSRTVEVGLASWVTREYK